MFHAVLTVVWCCAISSTDTGFATYQAVAAAVSGTPGQVEVCHSITPPSHAHWDTSFAPLRDLRCTERGHLHMLPPFFFLDAMRGTEIRCSATRWRCVA